MPRRVIVATDSGTDENADCDFGIIEVTDWLTGMLENRARLIRDLQRQSASVYEVHFWGCWCDFVSENALLEKHGRPLLPAAAEAQSTNEPADLPDNFEPPAEFEKTECDQVVLRINDLAEVEVAFTAIPKHTSLTITTNAIPLDYFFKKPEESTS